MSERFEALPIANQSSLLKASSCSDCQYEFGSNHNFCPICGKLRNALSDSGVSPILHVNPSKEILETTTTARKSERQRVKKQKQDENLKNEQPTQISTKAKAGEFKLSSEQLRTIVIFLHDNINLASHPKELFSKLLSLKMHMPTSYSLHAFGQRITRLRKDALVLHFGYQDFKESRFQSGEKVARDSDEFKEEFVAYFEKSEHRDQPISSLIQKYREVGIFEMLEFGRKLVDEATEKRLHNEQVAVKKSMVSIGDQFLLEGSTRRTNAEQQELMRKRAEYGDDYRKKIQEVQAKKIQMNIHHKKKKQKSKRSNHEVDEVEKEDVEVENTNTSSSYFVHELEQQRKATTTLEKTVTEMSQVLHFVASTVNDLKASFSKFESTN